MSHVPTIHTVYPENRYVSAAFVISTAHDRLIDAAVDLHGTAVEHTCPGVCAACEEHAAIAANVKSPTLEEALAFLSDEGIMEFDRRHSCC